MAFPARNRPVRRAADAGHLLVLARNPVRFRPLMPVAVLEKAPFGFPALALWLFVVAYLRTPQAAAAKG